MNFYPFHIGDFRSATPHLSDAEELAYRRALDWYYDTEQPIPLETQWVARRLRVDTDTLQTILDDFFIKTEEGWRHHRCDQELSKYNEIAERNRLNGKKGGRPKASKSGHKNPVGSQSVTIGLPLESDREGNQEPLTINQDKENGRSDDQPHRQELVEKGFEHFWKTWKAEKNRLGKVDTSAKRQTFEKKWKPMFNHSYWLTHTQDDYRAKVNQICEFVVEAHSVEGFNRFENMQTGRFFTEKQWEDK
jgi:uncharacterized protein YdaU (DUF1376 family)